MTRASQHVRFCASRDGTRIAFATAGSGPPMVRAAHWLSHLDHEPSCPLWGPWLNLLARRHRLIRYDGRGCGLSDWEATDFSLDRCVEDLEAVVDSCKLDRFVLFGATIGGMTALAYAARHPERVTHLIIIGGLAVGRMKRKPTPEAIEETALELKAIELGWGNDNPAFRQFFTTLFIPESTLEQARSLNQLLRVASTPEIAIRRLQPFHHIDLREAAAQVRCPTLVFHARHDARIPFEQGRLLAAHIPGARFVALDSRNHWVIETEPAWGQFTAEIDSFLPNMPDARAGAGVLDLLTRRELQIIDLVAAGLDNGTIGQQLGVSAKTVRNRVSVIFDKLGVSSRPQAIVWAREAGFGRKP
jgi:pimeloyl-ACP methyl ester carboxylesterase/DNA-binding CsgD family transcriptional regulator